MTKAEIRKVIRDSVEPHQICRIYLKYDYYYRYYFPLIVSEKLFLGAEEDDFILDGYCIRRIRDVEKAEIKDDKCLEINIAEGILENLMIPNVDITEWKTALISLEAMKINIIIENESLNDNDAEYVIGRIIKVMSSKVIFKEFDADGEWQDQLIEIPYTQISSVTFGSRYVEVFSKYVKAIG